MSRDEFVLPDGSRTTDIGELIDAHTAAERARILALLRDTVDRRRRVAEVFGGPYSRYFALIELESMLRD